MGAFFLTAITISLCALIELGCIIVAVISDHVPRDPLGINRLRRCLEEDDRLRAIPQDELEEINETRERFNLGPLEIPKRPETPREWLHYWYTR